MASLKIPRRYRNVAFKLLVLFAFLYLIVIAFDLRMGPPLDSELVKRNEVHKKLSESDNVNDNKHTEEDSFIGELVDNESDYEPEPPPPVDKNAPGEMGKAYKIDNPSPEVKKLIDQGWKNNAYNQYVSDLISIHRSLPDHRDPWCLESGRNLPVSTLPSTSVIVCFHNEGWSALLRTVHSIIDRSPPSLLKEIILVDDASTQDHLKKDLEDYISRYPKVKLVRAPERVGLIRARLMGASHSTAEVLTYLDSHCECSPGWLEPLLDRIARDPTNVVCPIIDIISDDTLAYQKSSYLAVGGFDWNLVFNWHGVPLREKQRRGHHAEPVHSPTMAGGLFAINREFFEKLGGYDPGFDIWGGENLELSFKTWMCGGTLEIIPCSHVGHIFRKRSPYKWRTGVNVLKRNSIRLAEVWLDDHKKYYYDRIGNDLGNFGDISQRKKLREDLECKSFKWYLDTVYPELFIPGDAVASGEIRNLWSGHGNQMCVDSASKKNNLHKPVGLYPCHNQGGNQYWMFSKTGEIRRDDACLDYAGGVQNIILFSCHGGKGNQNWEYHHDTQTIRHPNTHKCLTLAENKEKLLMEKCDSNEERQRWRFGSYNSTLAEQFQIF